MAAKVRGLFGPLIALQGLGEQRLRGVRKCYRYEALVRIKVFLAGFVSYPLQLVTRRYRDWKRAVYFAQLPDFAGKSPNLHYPPKRQILTDG